MQIPRKKILPFLEKISETKYLLPLLNCKIIWKSEKPAGAPTISHVMNTMLKSKRGGFIFYSRGQNIHKGGHIVGRLSNDDDNGDIYIVLKREIEALQPSQPLPSYFNDGHHHNHTFVGKTNFNPEDQASAHKPANTWISTLLWEGAKNIF